MSKVLASTSAQSAAHVINVSPLVDVVTAGREENAVTAFLLWESLTGKRWQKVIRIHIRLLFPSP